MPPLKSFIVFFDPERPGQPYVRHEQPLPVSGAPVAGPAASMETADDQWTDDDGTSDDAMDDSTDDGHDEPTNHDSDTTCSGFNDASAAGMDTISDDGWGDATDHGSDDASDHGSDDASDHGSDDVSDKGSDDATDADMDDARDDGADDDGDDGPPGEPTPSTSSSFARRNLPYHVTVNATANVPCTIVAKAAVHPDGLMETHATVQLHASPPPGLVNLVEVEVLVEEAEVGGSLYDPPYHPRSTGYGSGANFPPPFHPRSSGFVSRANRPARSVARAAHRPVASTGPRVHFASHDDVREIIDLDSDKENEEPEAEGGVAV